MEYVTVVQIMCLWNIPHTRMYLRNDPPWDTPSLPSQVQHFPLLCPLQTSAVCPLRVAALYYALREPHISHKYTERPNKRPVLSLYFTLCILKQQNYLRIDNR